MARALASAAKRFYCWVRLAAGLAVLARPAHGAPPEELSVRVSCPTRPGPGRVVCEVELEVDAGTLAWADVLVIEAPPFAAPLRARVGPSALFMKTEQRQRLQLALAASGAGSGRLRVRGRAVWCANQEKRGCLPLVREAEGSVRVGPIAD